MVPGLSPIMTQNFLSLRVYSALPLLECVFASVVLWVSLVREASHILVKTSYENLNTSQNANTVTQDDLECILNTIP